jgi:hypothetical protein
LSQDDHALKIFKSIFGGATRLGHINPEMEPYKSDLARRAFDDVRSVVGMIERTLLATGHQVEEDSKRVAL